ncbi:molybdopterin-synthase adenylyltransferase MoeB [Ectothiorhodospiraceae bacterium BW-2]|nr:molybdopterin-synthase adenylyltransferase MoeB [Ectothiorhodospiraceae bacterium BW-2]
MNDSELLRYSRQIMLPQIDIDGQQRLGRAKVALVGLGGLGVPAATYLASAGVGSLTLIDFDTIELSNLQRQPLYRDRDCGRYKVEVAAERLRQLAPALSCTTIERRLAAEELDDILNGHQLILDCSDNFATRFAINRSCYRLRVPLISAAATAFEAQLTLFDYNRGTGCYRCLYPDEAAIEEQSCATTGVVAPLVGIFGAMQALEAIKWLTGAGEPLVGRLLIADLLYQQWRTIGLRADPDCPVCGGE